MRNMIAFVIVGFCSSIAQANQPVNVDNRKETIKYECKFEGPKTCANCGEEKLGCKVEGVLCNEIDERGESRKCRDSKDPIEIRCTDGFKLESRDAAVELDNKTLWINADSEKEWDTLGERDDKIATIRVEDFIKDHRGEQEFRRKADLLTSKKEGEANHIDGVCKFEKKRDEHLK